MDGTDAQQPVIMGSLGKSRYKAVDNKERLPFTVFSGFSENIKPASGAITPNEVNDNSEEAQPLMYLSLLLKHNREVKNHLIPLMV